MDDRGNLPQRWSRPIEQMAQQSQRMENIIRDLLTLSQLETRAASRQQTTVQLHSLLSDIKQDAEQVFHEKQQQFALSCDPKIYIRGNISELYSAMSNLVREPVFIEYFNRSHYETPLKLTSPVDPDLILEFQITNFGAGERLMLIRDLSLIHI